MYTCDCTDKLYLLDCRILNDELYMKEGDPVRNVPRSLKEEGHRVTLAVNGLRRLWEKAGGIIPYCIVYSLKILVLTR